MGWAKYDEDIREELDERWAMREAYRPVTTYSNDYNWRKQQTVQRPATYSYQRATASYTYCAMQFIVIIYDLQGA